MGSTFAENQSESMMKRELGLKGAFSFFVLTPNALSHAFRA